VSFEIDAGSSVGIWGARRSGKSTLLRLATGLEPPDEGIVRFEGRDITRLSDRQHAQLVRRKIGLAPSSWRESRNVRVVDHVALPLLSAGASMREACVTAREVLERVGATNRADAFVAELSAGERTRVAIARALVRRPSLLLVDEPALTSSPTERDELYALLRSLAGEPRLTLVVGSEDIAAIRTARQAMTLSDGSVRSSAKPGQVVPFPEDRAQRGG
jgi:predicted ABC-type transport system involved in lysophospholipase L1 biosynthesis ATPase subunit